MTARVWMRQKGRDAHDDLSYIYIFKYVCIYMQRELVHTGIWLQSRRYKNQAAEHDAKSPTSDWREALARTCGVGPGRGPCTMPSRCHKRPGPPSSPAHGEALALTELCVSGEALPGGKPE